MIYLNVTNTFSTRAGTGIQRVVRELGGRLVQDSEYQLIVFKDGSLHVLTPGESRQLMNAEHFQPTETLALERIGRGDIFLDIDASWHDAYDVGRVWRQLKAQGCILVKMHYDAVPILFPEYASPETVFRFAENFSAALVLFDYWICISRTVEKDLHRIAQKMELGRPSSWVLMLGSDIRVPADHGGHIGQQCKQLLDRRYLITVGTVEPRKNHALILDAYEELVQDTKFSDMHLVIVGKLGWKNEETVGRIRGHPLFNQRIHWLQACSDLELDKLYRHAQVCLCLSHYEGYGLPAVEALARGVPVICTAGSAIEEAARGQAVGVALSRDDVVAGIKRLLLAAGNEVVNTYVPVSWDESALQLRQLLAGTQDGRALASAVRQAVYISIRPESLLRSVLSVQAHMAFIDEVVVLTSDACLNEIQQVLAAVRLTVTLISESELGIDVLPADHQERNTTLRRLLYQCDVIDANFIAFDDDYVVIRPVESTVFVEDGVHKAYFFHQDGMRWLGAAPAPTSFDVGVWKTAAYLSRAGYDTRLYNSHQPQIVNRSLAVEILIRTAGLGLDEWSSYFNIAKQLKPDGFLGSLYMTAGWPENFDSWLPCGIPEELAFFNDPRVGKNVAEQAEDWRTALIQAQMRACEPADLRLVVDDGKADFNHDTLRCSVGAKIFIPIVGTSHVEYFCYEFLNHRMEFHGNNTPNFIATFRMLVKRDFQIKVVARTQRSDQLLASLDVRVG